MCLFLFGLKGRDNIAQGAALGNVSQGECGLKGRDTSCQDVSALQASNTNTSRSQGCALGYVVPALQAEESGGLETTEFALFAANRRRTYHTASPIIRNQPMNRIREGQLPNTTAALNTTNARNP